MSDWEILYNVNKIAPRFLCCPNVTEQQLLLTLEPAAGRASRIKFQNVDFFAKDTEMEGTMIKRIGLLTSGGDCQALNATMRGVVKGLTNSIDDLEVYGFDD